MIIRPNPEIVIAITVAEANIKKQRLRVFTTDLRIKRQKLRYQTSAARHQNDSPHILNLNSYSATKTTDNHVRITIPDIINFKTAIAKQHIYLISALNSCHNNAYEHLVLPNPAFINRSTQQQLRFSDTPMATNDVSTYQAA